MRSALTLAFCGGALACCMIGARVEAELITFDEMPLGTVLDDVTIGECTFSTIPSASNPDYQIVIGERPINGGTFGATDNIGAIGMGDPDAVFRFSFDDPLEQFGFAMTTMPFSPAPFTMDLDLIDSHGDVVSELTFTTDILVVLTGGYDLLRYCQQSIDVEALSPDVRMIDMRISGGSNDWLMDNVNFSTKPVPGPSGAALILLNALLGRWRQRRR